jgi:hypothetical protein
MDDGQDRLIACFEPQTPELFKAFRRRRTRRQQWRRVVRAVDVNRQRALVAAARALRPLTRRLRQR